MWPRVFFVATIAARLFLPCGGDAAATTTAGAGVAVHFYAGRGGGAGGPGVACAHDRAVLRVDAAFDLLRARCAQEQEDADDLTEPWVGVRYTPLQQDVPVHDFAGVLERDTGGEVARFQLCTPGVRRAMRLEQDIRRPRAPRQVIWCSVDQHLCKKPEPAEAIGKGLFGAMDEDESQSTLSITFDQSTNMPPVEGVAGVDSVLSFSARIGKDYTGEWLSPRKLLITLVDTTDRADRTQLSVGNLNVYFVAKVPDDDDEALQTELAHKKAELAEQIAVLRSTNVSLRLARPGFYTAFYVNHHNLNNPQQQQQQQQQQQEEQATTTTTPTPTSTPATSISPSIPSATTSTNDRVVEVRACDDLVVGTTEAKTIRLGGNASSHAHQPDVNLPLMPFFAPVGVLSLDGTRSIRLPQKGFGNHHAWSMSMWLYIAEDSTGTHRGIFYKGPIPSDGHRTPSVWLLPHARQISLRFLSEGQL
jgi:hypothetical protein